MTDIKIGLLTKKYETSGKGVGYISNGDKWGDPGGISYGSYQLETKQGTMQAYLKSPEGGTYATELKKYKINSSEFKTAWKKLAADDPEGFEQSQFDYLANKPNGYLSAVAYMTGKGLQPLSDAFKAALYSTVNQSGGWKKIIDAAGFLQLDSAETQINKLYDARAGYFRRIKIGAAIRASIIKNRTVDERADALLMLGEIK